VAGTGSVGKLAARLLREVGWPAARNQVIPGYQRVNFIDIIENSDWPG
jgi:hypothetical protein